MVTVILPTSFAFALNPRQRDGDEDLVNITFDENGGRVSVTLSAQEFRQFVHQAEIRAYRLPSDLGDACSWCGGPLPVRATPGALCAACTASSSEEEEEEEEEEDPDYEYCRERAAEGNWWWQS